MPLARPQGLASGHLSVSLWRIVSLLALALSTINAPAQLAPRLPASAPVHNYDISISHPDSGALVSIALRTVDSLRSAAHLEANLDSIVYRPSPPPGTYLAHIHSGPRYTIGRIDLDARPGITTATTAAALSATYTKTPATPIALEALLRSLASDSSLALDPDATISLSALPRPGGILYIRIALGAPRPLLLAELLLTEPPPVRPAILAQLIGAPIGLPIDSIAITRIGRAISRLPYIRLEGPIEPEPLQKGIRLHLPVRPVRASSASAMLAMQPSSKGRGVQWVADLQATLSNLFRYGEQLQCSWQGNGPSHNNAHLSVAWPVLFHSRWGTTATFTLRQTDSLRHRYSLMVGATYALSPFQHLQLAALSARATDIMLDPSPQRISTRTASLQLGYTLDMQDYSQGWQQGFYLESQCALGARRVGRSPTGGLLEPTLAATWTHPWGARGLFTRLRGSAAARWPLFGAQPLLPAERLHTGGARSVRGFLQRQHATTAYATLSLEPGWWLGPWAELTLFGDGAILEYHKTTALLIGYGVGCTLQTQAGLLQIAVAQGRSSTRSIPPSPWLLHLALLIRF